jgi:hypothetical protein
VPHTTGAKSPCIALERELHRVDRMLTRRLVLAVPLLLVVRRAHAIELGAVSLRNASNASCGQVESNGTVRNSSNASVGRIEKDGVIRNGSNASIGRVESDGTVRDGSNASIGRVEADGTIRNGSNASIGRIESNGTIRNGSNASVGHVEGYSPSLRHLVAALLFFFGGSTGLSL